MAKRKIVKIDEDKCTGCGICIPNCAEGALEIIDGKARLVKEIYCDGLGACLGDCPEGAITIEEREADEFDEKAVEERLNALKKKTVAPPPASPCGGGCPGSMLRTFAQPSQPEKETAATAPAVSRLQQWPIQLHLLPPVGDLWRDADVLIAADCVAFSMPDFHERLLKGKTVAIGCPKLDDTEEYVRKLTDIFGHNSVKSVTVAHMEVPCCSGIVRAARLALQKAERTEIPFHDILVGIRGEVLSES